MATLSHRAFRELITEYGHCDIFFTEMANAASLLAGGRWESHYMCLEPLPERCVVQVLGSRSEDILSALKFLRTHYSKIGRAPLGYDINMGCAAPEILRSGAGAAWLGRPAEIRELLKAARDIVTDANLSIKIRIPDKSNQSSLGDFCLGLAELGLDFISIHPRFIDQGYSRAPHWELVSSWIKDIPIPVFLNGDIRHRSDIERLRSFAPNAGFMIGREAARRAWVFAALRSSEQDSPRRLDCREYAARFCQLAQIWLPPEFLESRLRRFFFYFFENFNFGNRPKYRCQAFSTPSQFLNELEAYLRESPAEANISLC